MKFFSVHPPQIITQRWKTSPKANIISEKSHCHRVWWATFSAVTFPAAWPRPRFPQPGRSVVCICRVFACVGGVRGRVVVKLISGGERYHEFLIRFNWFMLMRGFAKIEIHGKLKFQTKIQSKLY